MRFQVPQFIEVEDKIFGPLTFKQFVYVAGGAGLAVLSWVILPTLIAIPLMIGAVALGLSLAFLKINDKPFIEMMQAAFYYFFNHKLYIWKKEVKKAKASKSMLPENHEVSIPKLSGSKLREISWALDVQDLEQGGDKSER